jgi:AcrR family transcriptional regulator
MADLAAAIKLSRPALYVFFADRDEIFTAVIRSLNDKMLNELRQTLPKLPTLDRRLHRCCAAWLPRMGWTEGLDVGRDLITPPSRGWWVTGPRRRFR